MIHCQNNEMIRDLKAKAKAAESEAKALEGVLRRRSIKRWT